MPVHDGRKYDGIGLGCREFRVGPWVLLAVARRGPLNAQYAGRATTDAGAKVHHRPALAIVKGERGMSYTLGLRVRDARATRRPRGDRAIVNTSPEPVE